MAPSLDARHIFEVDNAAKVQGQMVALIYWDDEHGGLVVVDPAERFHANLASFEALKAARTFGDLRRASLEPWARHVVEVQAQYLEDDEDVEVDDETSWDYERASDMIGESAPLPHAAEVVVRWLGHKLLDQHADVGGAIPGGDIDIYEIRDRDAFFHALRERGYQLEHRPGLLGAYFSAL